MIKDHIGQNLKLNNFDKILFLIVVVPVAEVTFVYVIPVLVGGLRPIYHTLVDQRSYKKIMLAAKGDMTTIYSG